jgi:hypothetical protein
MKIQVEMSDRLKTAFAKADASALARADALRREAVDIYFPDQLEMYLCDDHNITFGRPLLELSLESPESHQQAMTYLCMVRHHTI